MSPHPTGSIKENPQYYIKFVNDPNKPEFTYDTIICWVVVTKMLVVQNNIHEDEEKSKDFMALHVYPNKKEGKKVLDSHGALIRSIYTNEQSITLYLNLKAHEYYKV